LKKQGDLFDFMINKNLSKNSAKNV